MLFKVGVVGVLKRGGCPMDSELIRFLHHLKTVLQFSSDTTCLPQTSLHTI